MRLTYTWRYAVYNEEVDNWLRQVTGNPNARWVQANTGLDLIIGPIKGPVRDPSQAVVQHHCSIGSDPKAKTHSQHAVIKIVPDTSGLYLVGIMVPPWPVVCEFTNPWGERVSVALFGTNQVFEQGPFTLTPQQAGARVKAWRTRLALGRLGWQLNDDIVRAMLVQSRRPELVKAAAHFAIAWLKQHNRDVQEALKQLKTTPPAQIDQLKEYRNSLRHYIVNGARVLLEALRAQQNR